MSKCGVCRIEKSNLSYWTLLRPKYCAPAGADTDSTPRATRMHCFQVTKPSWSLAFGVVVRRRVELTERLIEIGDEVGRIFEADGQSQHAARDTRITQLLVGVPPLRGQHRQADQALDAAKAGGALDDLESVVAVRRALVIRGEIEAHHTTKPGHLLLRNRVVGMIRQSWVIDAAHALVGGQEFGDRVGIRVVPRHPER